MKISLEWLKEFVDLRGSVEKTRDRLTALGFPVASISRTGLWVDHVVAGEILSVEKHPNADRLNIARVHDGQRDRTIVCGAANIVRGQRVPLARPGVRFPTGLTIEVTKIRGVESEGMLCSGKELGVSEDQSGILQLPQATKPGTDLKDVLGRGDVIFDVEVTPNRPDVLSHLGIARELAALLGVPLKRPLLGWKPRVKSFPCRIDVQYPGACPGYLGKRIHRVRVGPSPAWMVRRLAACGIRSINNIVDITNYVLLEWGHPLHAFDLGKLQGGRILVRRALAGEKIVALDEKTYTLTESDLIIADEKGPVAIAGIMGGEDSGVTEQTTDILLESAVFDRRTIRATSKRLGLKSESSIRFEKGTDLETAAEASLRAAGLIMELACGEPGGQAEAISQKPAKIHLHLSFEKLNAVVGMNFKKQRVRHILKALEFSPRPSKNGWTCGVPAYRKDILEDIDLIEEVIRMIGYDNLPETLAPLQGERIPESLRVINFSSLSGHLKGLGLNEAMTSSFCSPRFMETFGWKPDQLITLKNPVSMEETALRPILIAPLLKAVMRNMSFQRNAVHFFEIGKKYLLDENFKPIEREGLSMVLYGEAFPKTWQSDAKVVDFYFLKGLFESINSDFNFQLSLQKGAIPSFLHPHQSFNVTKNNQVIGWMGMIHPKIAISLDLKLPCAVAEWDIQEAWASQKHRSFRALAKTHFVERDVAMVVDKNTPWETFRSLVEEFGGSLVKKVIPFDIFSGAPIDPSKKSVAFRVRLQHQEQTLSELEINQTIEKIKTSLRDRCGAELR